MRDLAKRCGAVGLLSMAIAFAAGIAAPRSSKSDDLKTEPTTKGDPAPTTKVDPGPTTKPPPLPPPVKPDPPTPTPKPDPTPKPSSSSSASASASTSAGGSASGSASGSGSGDPTKPEVSPKPKKLNPLRDVGPTKLREIALNISDLEVSLQLPEIWKKIDESILPPFDDGGREGVKELVRTGYGTHAPKATPPELSEVVVVCGKAPGSYWADAVREAAFTTMIASIEKEAKNYSSVETIEPGEVRTEGNRWEQSYRVDAELTGKNIKKGEANPVRMVGTNFLGFAKDDGKDPNLVVCAVSCIQRLGEGDDDLCERTIASIKINGTFEKPPKTSWIVEIVMRMRRDPVLMYTVVGGAVVLLVMLIAVPILIMRRRKGRATEAHEDDLDFQDAVTQAVEEIGKLHASAPPDVGYFDPVTLQRKRT